jgi:hypothetical protein
MKETYGSEACLDRQPTVHQLQHLSRMIQLSGSLCELDTSAFEHVHVFLKDVFSRMTNHCMDEELLVPQMMTAMAHRLFSPHPPSNSRPGERSYDTLHLVAPSRTFVEAWMQEVNPGSGVCVVAFNAAMLCNLLLAAVAGVRRYSAVDCEPFGVRSPHEVKEFHFHKLSLVHSTACRGPFGWIRDHRKQKENVVSTGNNQFFFVVSIMEFQATLLERVHLTGPILFCKRLKPLLSTVVCPRFQLPSLCDFFERDASNSYVLLKGADISQVWSLVQVASINEATGNCFFACPQDQ